MVQEEVRAVGYEFVPVEGSSREADAVLRQVSDPTKGFAWEGQEHYDKLGDAVTSFLYSTLEGKYGMTRHNLSKDDVDVPVFHAGLDRDTIVVLVQGSGAVTPGMWARSLCINNSLHEGTIFPYVKAAQDRGWGVLVACPNIVAAGNECSELHTKSLFETFVHDAPAKKVLVVAHSYGGWSMMYYLKTCTEAQRSRITCVAMTDSVHGLCASVPTEAEIRKAKNPEKRREHAEYQKHLRELVPEAFQPPSTEVLSFLQERCKNWVQSAEPLGAPISPNCAGVPTVSAGHEDHVWTSGVSFPDVFRFLDSFLPPKELLASDKLAQARTLKDSGNALMKAKEYKKASFTYKQADIYLHGLISVEDGDEMMSLASNVMKKQSKAQGPTPAELAEAQALRLTIKNNICQARLGLEDWAGAAKFASEVLALDAENTKARFRRCRAYLKLNDLANAEADFAVVQGAEQSDPRSVQELLQGLKKLRTASANKEKKVYSAMFQ